MKQIIKQQRNEGGQFVKGNVSWNTGIQVPQIQGENHPSWKGGTHKTARRILIREGEDLSYCRICKDNTKKIIIHHCDGNSYNNKRFNQAIICTYCHNAIHGIGINTRFQKGHIPSEKTREKISKANKGKHYSPATEFKKGNKAHLGHFKNKPMGVII